MLYSEFKSTYPYATRTWPETGNLFDRPIEIIVTKAYFDKVGTRWAESERTTERVDVTHYMNIVDAVPFFRNIGGHERVTRNYTKYGFLPVHINSVSPDRMRKVVYDFDFV